MSAESKNFCHFSIFLQIFEKIFPYPKKFEQHFEASLKRFSPIFLKGFFPICLNKIPKIDTQNLGFKNLFTYKLQIIWSFYIIYKTPKIAIRGIFSVLFHKISTLFHILFTKFENGGWFLRRQHGKNCALKMFDRYKFSLSVDNAKKSKSSQKSKYSDEELSR